MRFCTASEAVELIRDGTTIIVDGSGGGVNEPGTILEAVEEKFLETGSPRDLCVMHISGMGSGNGDGIDRFAHVGMVKRVIGGHWGWTQRMQNLAADNLIEAYCLPQGTLSHLLRVTAAHGPGVVSHIGLNTFVDPRIDGGRLNSAAVDDIVELVYLSGKEWIFTPVIPLDIAIIRGTTADEHGNITMEGEGLLAETLAAAQAVKNNGGKVLAQVRNRVPAGRLFADQVRIPGILIDAIVVDPTQRLSAATDRDQYLEGRERFEGLTIPPMEFGVRKVIARRAATELRKGDIINLGFGMPDGVASVLAEEGKASEVTFTVEQGHIGGLPAGGSDFGMARNAEASVTSGQQFDWYDGGGVDVAVLSFAEVDANGNVNVGRFGRKAPGVGGFINISQGSHRIVFVGTFVAGGEYGFRTDGSIVLPEGGTRKFVDTVEQISFSGERANSLGQPVLYVSERAVFELGPEGPVLVELAPGADLERDVIANMGFRPRIAESVKVMDPAFFTTAALRFELGDPSAVGAR